MEKKELKFFREELINEIKGIVSTKGSLDISKNIKVLRCYRGMDAPFVCAVMYCDRNDGMLPISGWFRSVVCHLTLKQNGDLIVCCDTTFTCAEGLCLDDLLDIRDFIRNMSEEEITLCNHYDFSEEEELNEEVKEEFIIRCELPWSY